MRVTISIPTRLLAPLADALAGRYGYTAEALQHASANTPPPRRRDPDLIETLGMLDQIDTELTEIAGNDHVVEVALTGERQLLSAAVYDLLQHRAAALMQACERFPTGTDDVPDLEQANRHVGEVLRLFRETELVSVQHPDHKSLS
jgi:hypothetical protein